MRIAFATPAYFPAKIGASFYSQELAEGLVKKGHEVRVVVPLPIREKGLKERETRNGVEIARIPLGANWERFRKITGVPYYISRTMLNELSKERSDIIHSHHYGYYPATAGFQASKQTGTPHAFGPYYHPPIYGAKRKLLAAIYHRKYGKKILKESAAVLPHTEHEKRLLLGIGAIEDNMKILPNIVDTDKFTPGKRKEKVVLFVGNFLREKGADVAMRIAENLIREREDVEFMFVGSIHGDYPHKKEMEWMKIRLLATERAFFLSNLKKQELIKAYQRASVLLLPSRYEAFSRVIAEAQACGCAVVSTKVGAIPEVVRDGETGFLVEYGDWKSMEERLKQLLDNPNKARKIGMSGSRRMKKHFDRKTIVTMLEKIYDDLV